MSPDNFFQESSSCPWNMTMDYVVFDVDTVAVGGRMIRRKKNKVNE